MKNKSTWKTCGRKVRYKTEKDATTAIKNCTNKRPDSNLDYYLCPYCQGFHLTHTAFDYERMISAGAKYNNLPDRKKNRKGRLLSQQRQQKVRRKREYEEEFY